MVVGGERHRRDPALGEAADQERPLPAELDHRREPPPVHRGRRGLHVVGAVAERAGQRGARLRAAELAHPTACHDEARHVGARLDLGGERGDVLAGEVAAVRQERLAVGQQPHAPDVHLGQRQHHLRGEQHPGRLVEIAEAGEVDDDGAVLARRHVRAQLRARREQRDGRAGQRPGRPGEQQLHHARGLCPRRHARHVAHVGDGEPPHRVDEPGAHRLVVVPEDRERHDHPRREVGDPPLAVPAHDCDVLLEHRLRGLERAGGGEAADRGAADADRRGVGARGAAAPGAGTVSNWPSSTVRPAASSQPSASGARNRRAAPCRSVLLPDANTKSRTRSSGLLPATGPGGTSASSLPPTWRSTWTGELSGTLAHPATAASASSRAGTSAAGRRVTARPAVSSAPRRPATPAPRPRASRRCRHRRRLGGGRRRLLRTERQRARLDDVVERARQRQPERGALPDLAPCLQPPAVQAGVLDGDREPQPAAAAAPGARLLGAPEPVEHQARLAGAQPDAVVAHQHGDGPLVGAEHHADGLALAVVDRVGHEVAHDALDTARVDLGVHADGQSAVRAVCRSRRRCRGPPRRLA